MTSKPETTEALDHLRPETARWYAEVCHAFDLESHHKRLLRLACESWDAGQAAREAIVEHGTVFTDRFDQPRARPEVAISRDSRTQFARLVRELGLDLSEPETPKPPTITRAKGV